MEDEVGGTLHARKNWEIHTLHPVCQTVHFRDSPNLLPQSGSDPPHVQYSNVETTRSSSLKGVLETS